MCTEAGCEQRDPPLPSDGAWECRDELGAMVCRGGTPPAGVPEGPRDPGFECAPLEDGREVCVALRMPMPEGAARGFGCAVDHDPAPVRRCVRDPSAPALGASCGECAAPLVCTGGRCDLPARDERACWIDADCAGPACVVGRCAR